MRVAALPVLAACVLAATACRSEKQGRLASAELLGLEADQVLVELEHYMTREGVRRATLVADTAFTYQDEARLRLRNLQITFFGDVGASSGVLTARRGEYLMESGDVTVEGEVVVSDPGKGDRLLTERLRYVAETDSLYGDTSFILYRGGIETRGTSFVSDPGLKNIRTESPSYVSPGADGARPVPRSKGQQ